MVQVEHWQLCLNNEVMNQTQPQLILLKNGIIIIVIKKVNKNVFPSRNRHQWCAIFNYLEPRWYLADMITRRDRERQCRVVSVVVPGPGSLCTGTGGSVRQLWRDSGWERSAVEWWEISDKTVRSLNRIYLGWGWCYGGARARTEDWECDGGSQPPGLLLPLSGHQSRHQLQTITVPRSWTWR